MHKVMPHPTGRIDAKLLAASRAVPGLHLALNTCTDMGKTLQAQLCSCCWLLRAVFRGASTIQRNSLQDDQDPCLQRRGLKQPGDDHVNSHWQTLPGEVLPPCLQAIIFIKVRAEFAHEKSAAGLEVVVPMPRQVQRVTCEYDKEVRWGLTCFPVGIFSLLSPSVLPLPGTL